MSNTKKAVRPDPTHSGEVRQSPNFPGLGEATKRVRSINPATGGHLVQSLKTGNEVREQRTRHVMDRRKQTEAEWDDKRQHANSNWRKKVNRTVGR